MYLLYKYVVFYCIAYICNLLSPCKLIWTNWERLNDSYWISHYILRLTQMYNVCNKQTLYHVSIIIIVFTMISHIKYTFLLIDLIYSCMFALMIKWYALYKIIFNIGIMLIIICKHSFRIIIFVNCFIFIVLCVKIPTCIMCSHLYSITPIIMISRLCIILPRRIFVSLLLYIFCNLALNYYQQLILTSMLVITHLLHFNFCLFYIVLKSKILIRLNILYLSFMYPIMYISCWYYILNDHIRTLSYLNVIIHQPTHFKRNLDLNPLTTNKYCCINHINQPIMVYPVFALPNVTAINPDDNYDSGILDMSPGDIVENDTFQGQIDDDKYDYSILGSIDPDTHYFKYQRNTICKNYTEESFNKSFDFQNNFLFIM